MKQTERQRWKLQIGGYNCIFFSGLVNPPNAFHRFMAWLLLGFYWSKMK